MRSFKLSWFLVWGRAPLRYLIGTAPVTQTILERLTVHFYLQSIDELLLLAPGIGREWVFKLVLGDLRGIV